MMKRLAAEMHGEVSWTVEDLRRAGGVGRPTRDRTASRAACGQAWRASGDGMWGASPAQARRHAVCGTAFALQSSVTMLSRGRLPGRPGTKGVLPPV